MPLKFFQGFKGFLFLCFFSLQVGAQDHFIETGKSKIRWTGRKVTGSHVGFLKVQSGMIRFKYKKLVKGNIAIDMNSMTCTDIKDEKNNLKLLNHLKNPDFFSTDSFPTASFQMEQAIPIDAGTYLIKGSMTIKGISNPQEFRLDLEKKNSQIIISGKITIDRTLYSIRYKSSSFFDGLGDRMIHDDFDLDLYLVFNTSP